MNDRARFDVLVCSRPCGWRNRGAAAGVRDASKELKCVTIYSASGLLATPR